MENIARIFRCIILIVCTCRYVKCSFSLPGETSPASVEIEVGDSVNISCRMNPKVFPDRTVGDLYFMDAYSHVRVPKSEIIILNDTTILYVLRNARESKLTYRCMCGSNAIMETKVYVGHKPDAITDFTCRSYNYENMKCNFTKPDNHVLTQYNVSYHFDLKAYKYSPTCDHERSPLVTCTALHANENIFHYEITSTNSLGTLTQQFDVDNMSVMVLAPPGQNFSLKHVTADSATFTFRLKNPSKSLLWKVVLHPKNLSEIDLSSYVRPAPASNNEYVLNLTNLKFAYYEYRIDLRVRLSTINSWSEPFSYWFRTLPRLPDRPPRTDVGAFETDPSEKQIRLYWELLEPFEHNGYNFTYLVEQIGAAQSTKPLLLESNSAVFLWKKEFPYEFSIRSKNHLGVSESFSRITIPAMAAESKRKTHTPPAVHNMYHERNGTFTLSWDPPTAQEYLVDYTVFWCRKRSLLLNACEGSIHFQHVPLYVHNFTSAPQEHTLSLAVSANYKDFNTGMHWTECTEAEATDLIRMEPKIEATSAYTIRVEWGLENICPSIIDGYNLSYCAVDVNPDKTDIDIYNCTSNEPEQYKLINKNFKRWELQNLKPFTHYKVEIFMYSKLKFGKKSNAQIVQTWEAAPTPPLELNLLHKSNTSATISWLPPNEPNGIIRAYRIFVNGRSVSNPTIHKDTSGRFVCKLENLSSSTSYTVYVIAETVVNLMSARSNEWNFTTLVGYPFMPGPVSLHDGKHDAEIEWILPAGRADFYEVAITLMKGEEILGRHISIVIGSSCAFRVPTCFDHEYRTTVEVRSVNAALIKSEVDANTDNEIFLDEREMRFYEDFDELSCTIKSSVDERQSDATLQEQKVIELYTNTSVYRLYKSKWQRGPIFSCAASTLGTIMLYIFLATFFAGCLVMVIVMVRQKYNKMANINCTLPAGLNAYMTKDFSSVSAVLSHNFISITKGDTMNNQNCSVIEDRNDVITDGCGRDSMTQNEEHCLLEATSLNSLNISDHQVQQMDLKQHRESSQNISPTLLENKSLRKGRHFELPSESEIDADYLKDTPTIDSLSGKPSVSLNIDSPYVQATDILNQCHNETMEWKNRMIPENNSYIKPDALNNWQNINQKQFENFNPQEGYVSADNIDKVLPISLQDNLESGYTNVENIMKLPPSYKDAGTENEMPFQSSNSQHISAQNLIASNSNGYTTLDQLNKMSTLTPAVSTWGAPNQSLPSEVRPAISGYVTQRELNAFGQQQQNFL